MLFRVLILPNGTDAGTIAASTRSALGPPPFGVPAGGVGTSGKTPALAP